MTALLPLATWVPILDGDPTAAHLYEQHYSARRHVARRHARGTRLFVGPGNKLVLSTPCRSALFVWRREKHRRDGQVGIECAVFANRSEELASILIRAADAIADDRWPGERHFTFVEEGQVRGNPPGNVFRRAGWRECGRSRCRGLLILERPP